MRRRGGHTGFTRRDVLHSGLSALALGALRLKGGQAPLRARDPLPAPGDLSGPFAEVPLDAPSTVVGGFRFSEGFTGDPWLAIDMPFHTGQLVGEPPEPTETVEVAIVGGGLSGLATAYFLRHRRPVLFELRPRFGGVSQGESWADTRYSMGGAYFIAPDERSFLADLYHELGLDHVARVSEPEDDPVELGGTLRDDFFAGLGTASLDDRLAFERYANAVKYFADKSYPDIPLVEGKDNRWILELDRSSLREDVERRIGMPIPRLLESAVQAYCYSSFNAGWERISAAAGWNFVAAEEYGRWVCPGGNVWVCDVLWRRIAKAYGPDGQGRLRPGTRVVDVRPSGRRFLVTYRMPDGTQRSLLADQVVMACSKHICKYVLHDLAATDPERIDAMHQVETTAYLVANVLLEQPLDVRWYDLLLLGDGAPPAPGDSPRVTDVVAGHYASVGSNPRSVLTLYWPIPSSHTMFTVLADDAWQSYSGQLVPQLERVLRILNVEREKVRQVRLSRWGHAMPIARVGFIQDGTAAKLRSPYLERVWFVNQDNWALPAFETSVLEAKHFAERIDALAW